MPPPGTPRQPRDDDEYLDLREEWTPGTAPPPAPASDPAPPLSAYVEQADQPSTVRGTARTVVAREHAEHGHVLEFRVDRYDASGNRAVPVPVRMVHHRHGQVADGDEVELSGKWVNGTLETRRVANRTTGAEVQGGLPSAKPLLVGCAGFLVVALLVTGVLMFLAGRDDPPSTVVVPDLTGFTNVDAARTLNDAALRSRTVGEPSTTVRFGRVIRTDPAAGASVPRESTVVVYFSEGVR